MKAPSYLSVVRAPATTREVTVEVKLELRSPAQVLAFAWDMARSVSVGAWWWRPLVFFGLLVCGFELMLTRRSLG